MEYRVSLPKLLLALLVLGSCKQRHTQEHPFPTSIQSPLEQVGISREVIEELHALGVSAAEANQLAKVKRAGASDQTCVELLQIAREQKRGIGEGADIASLRRVGMSDDAILELVRMKGLGPWTRDVRAMRSAGMSDDTIVDIARFRAAGRPVFSGSSFVRLRRSGMRDETLVDLVHRGVPETDVELLVRLRQEGVSDTAILQRYPRR
jgi:hypothetical protein